MKQIITLRTPFGRIKIDDDGSPLYPLPEPYSHIIKFDVDRLKKMCYALGVSLNDEYEFPAIGYWTHAGYYQKPSKVFDEDSPMRHVWNGRAGDEDDYSYSEYDF